MKQKHLFLILGNQLFPHEFLPSPEECEIYMAEHVDLCADIRHHQQKVMMFFGAMRSHAKVLRDKGYVVHYQKLKVDSPSFLDLLKVHVQEYQKGLMGFEIVDPEFDERVRKWAKKEGLEVKWWASPMFLNSQEEVLGYLGDKRPLMAKFYKGQRVKWDLLVSSDGQPEGGQWSYDEDNRKKIPAHQTLPAFPRSRACFEKEEIQELIESHLSHHPGRLETFIWPTTREEALEDMEEFFKKRFYEFGPFEDALHPGHPTLWHSWLSGAMNLGLLTPKEVIEKAMTYKDKVPINSLEGFIRQIIGWREFVRGIHLKFGELQKKENFFQHQRKLSPAWWQGTTGVPPLDQVIVKCLDYGYAHHIERLMIVSNMMVLCEIEPREAHKWFMEMFIDSSEWVMGPNVYGMGLFSDGGTFATKPYICSSNYWIKMGAGKKDEWCDIVDGLYWRFVEKHQTFFEKQGRMSHVVRNLKRLKPERRKRLSEQAEAFLKEMTL